MCSSCTPGRAVSLTNQAAKAVVVYVQLPAHSGLRSRCHPALPGRRGARPRTCHTAPADRGNQAATAWAYKSVDGSSGGHAQPQHDATYHPRFDRSRYSAPCLTCRTIRRDSTAASLMAARNRPHPSSAEIQRAVSSSSWKRWATCQVGGQFTFDEGREVELKGISGLQWVHVVEWR